MTTAVQIKLLLEIDDLSTIPRLSNAGIRVPCRVINVVDGDTVNVAICENGQVTRTSIRIQGVDTPEKARASVNEIAAGKQVKRLIARLLEEEGNGGGCSGVDVVRYKHDKYGGRQVGDVYFGGTSLSAYLLENQLGLPYNGGTKTPWTDAMLQEVYDRASCIIDDLLV